jgi:hypothetical protein
MTETALIHETLGTLETSLTHETLIANIVCNCFGLKPQGFSGYIQYFTRWSIGAFIIMRYVGIQANIVALSGMQSPSESWFVWEWCLSRTHSDTWNGREKGITRKGKPLQI